MFQSSSMMDLTNDSSVIADQSTTSFSQHISSTLPVIETLSLSLDQMSEIPTTNFTGKDLLQTSIELQYDTQVVSLPYQITFGFLCASLCILTIIGNLLVLITFRRIRTVSTNKQHYLISICQFSITFPYQSPSIHSTRLTSCSCDNYFNYHSGFNLIVFS